MPSAKNSRSFSELVLAKGRTAIDLSEIGASEAADGRRTIQAAAPANSTTVIRTAKAQEGTRNRFRRGKGYGVGAVAGAGVGGAPRSQRICSTNACVGVPWGKRVHCTRRNSGGTIASPDE